jgi:mannose/fructose/N-acetylgalactosamine-specific phosphotransferase system component IIC
MIYLLAGLVYAFLNLDQIAVGPFLLSRPLVVGSIIGAVLGNAPLGFTAGLSAELMLISVPSSGPAATDLALIGGLAAFWAVEAYASRGAAVVLALLLAVPCGWASRRADLLIRRQNDRFGDWIVDGLTAGRERILWKALATWSALWFVKAWVVFAAVSFLGLKVVDWCLNRFPLRVLDGLDRGADLFLVVGFAAALSHFWGRLRPVRTEQP